MLGSALDQHEGLRGTGVAMSATIVAVAVQSGVAALENR